jgi:hypothetical protein
MHAIPVHAHSPFAMQEHELHSSSFLIVPGMQPPSGDASRQAILVHDHCPLESHVHELQSSFFVAPGVHPEPASDEGSPSVLPPHAIPRATVMSRQAARTA